VSSRVPAAVRAGAVVQRAPAWAITAVLGLAYVITAPPSADLAAASYRADLFGRVGFSLWDNGWYAGHHLPAYSVFAPALAWLIGPLAVAAISMTVAAALFGALIEARFPAPAVRVASMWFAIGAAVGLLASRVPFDLGLAVGLGSLLLAQRGRRALSLAAAVVCALASPVAGAFLGLAALGWALAERSRRFPLMLLLAALLPIAVLTLAFPEGGSQPFVGSAFYPDLAGVLVLAGVIGRGRRALRAGTLLYGAALIGCYAIPTAVGGNVDRLGALVAGPLAACVLAGSTASRRRMLVALAPILFYWQANAPVADFLSAASDPAVHASYYAPLLGELRVLGVGYSARPARIEVVPTRDHWEARFVAPQIAIARGWERQLDTYRNGLFYSSQELSAARYEAWLSEQAIAYVALPDAPLDYSGRAEARLVRSGELSASGDAAGAGRPPRRVALREVWRSAHWRLFAVLGVRALAQPPALLTQLGSDSFTLSVPRAGRYVARVRFTSYWAISRGAGCVREAPGGWTELEASRAGRLHVVIGFSLARVFSHGPRCR